MTFHIVTDEHCPPSIVKLVGTEQTAVLSLEDGSIFVRTPTYRERQLAGWPQFPQPSKPVSNGGG